MLSTKPGEQPDVSPCIMCHPIAPLVPALLQQLLELLLCVVELVRIRLRVPVAGCRGRRGGRLLDQSQSLQVDSAALLKI